MFLERLQHGLISRVGDAPREHGSHEVTPHALVEQLNISVLEVVDHFQGFVSAEELPSDACLHVRFDDVERIEERRYQSAEQPAAEEIVERVVQFTFGRRQKLFDALPGREEHHVGETVAKTYGTEATVQLQEAVLFGDLAESMPRVLEPRVILLHLKDRLDAFERRESGLGESGHRRRDRCQKEVSLSLVHASYEFALAIFCNISQLQVILVLRAEHDGVAGWFLK